MAQRISVQELQNLLSRHGFSFTRTIRIGWRLSSRGKLFAIDPQSVFAQICLIIPGNTIPAGVDFYRLEEYLIPEDLEHL